MITNMNIVWDNDYQLIGGTNNITIWEKVQNNDYIIR